jgi:hypothetical protein
MSLRSSIFLIVAALSLIIPGTRCQESLLSPRSVVEIARAVNTTEVEFLAKSKHAVDLRSLRSHKRIQDLESIIEFNWDANADEFSAKGYDVRLALTNDQTQYTLTILPKRDQGKSEPCPPAFVTNESGVIYQALALGCQSSSRAQ